MDLGERMIFEFIMLIVRTAATIVLKVIECIPAFLKFLYKSGLYWFLGVLVLLRLYYTNKIEETIWMDALAILFMIATAIAVINRILSFFKKQKINILKIGIIKLYELLSGSSISSTSIE